jgi:hypothetical protein
MSLKPSFFVNAHRPRQLRLVTTKIRWNIIHYRHAATPVIPRMTRHVLREFAFAVDDRHTTIQ